MDGGHLSTLEHYSKEELAYRGLRSAILAGELPAGERLVPAELASRLSVSTMPVRQALMRLEAEKLVCRMRNGGLAVAPLSVKEVEETYSMRAVLEGFAARTATPKLTPELLQSLRSMVAEMEFLSVSGQLGRLSEINARFHFAIYEAAGNDRLLDTLRNLWATTMRYRHLYYSDSGVSQRTLEEHREILAALERGDAAKVEEVVRSARTDTASVLCSKLQAAPSAT